MFKNIKIAFATLAFCLFSFSLNGSETYISNPPKGWSCIADPDQLPQKIKILFVGKAAAQNQFTPTINVAVEETPLSLKDYVALAKSYHEGQGTTRCIPLGKIKTLAGDAELIQIDRASQWGEVRFLQAMLISKGTAYVITGTCLKKEFSANSAPILKSIQSFTLPPGQSG